MILLNWKLGLPPDLFGLFMLGNQWAKKEALCQHRQLALSKGNWPLLSKEGKKDITSISGMQELPWGISWYFNVL